MNRSLPEFAAYAPCDHEPHRRLAQPRRALPLSPGTGQPRVPPCARLNPRAHRRPSGGERAHVPRQPRPGKYRDGDAERYGYALKFTRTRQYDAARTEIQKLIGAPPGASGPSSRRGGKSKPPPAVMTRRCPLYAAARLKFPGYSPLLRTHAEVLLKAGRAGEARDFLRLALKRQPDDPALYRLAGAGGGRLWRPRRGAPGAGGGAVSERLPGRGHRASAKSPRARCAIISIFNPASRHVSAPSARKLRSTAGAS